MAILNSTKSRRKTNPQVPLVIISQPLSGPIAGQSSPAPQLHPQQTTSDTAAAAAAILSAAMSPSDLQTEVVSDPSESPGEPARTTTDMTSLPVANEEAVSEPTASEAPPTADEERAAFVSVSPPLFEAEVQQISSV